MTGPHRQTWRASVGILDTPARELLDRSQIAIACML